ncbi:PAP2 superfamily protein [Balneicella halophila]|uniref:PAP2 superfamily protein n=1 Tax=Balneicella halophila TaxID=1537566 RepID=A0A7L4UPX6_BALHA|nr:phosphatase PAP2 family protein [Balneicella halophila]PVX51816.1 PAP2 superfamily protein [Balneicella halophila]
MGTFQQQTGGFLCNCKLNDKVIDNFDRVSFRILMIPLFIMVLFCLYFVFFNTEDSFVEGYINMQKQLFIYLNSHLSKFPHSQYNITQLGDVLIFFPLISVFILYAPKMWEALRVSSLFSLIVVGGLKKILAGLGTARILELDSFVIVGKKLTGATSLPSGHSSSVFLVITIVLFAFMSRKKINRVIWILFMTLLGLFIALSRVAVGAHYPQDVLIGSALGFSLTVIGIKLSTKINCVRRKQFYPISILILMIWTSVIVQKIVDTNLTIFYIAMIGLTLSLFLISKFYLQKTLQTRPSFFKRRVLSFR